MASTTLPVSMTTDNTTAVSRASTTPEPPSFFDTSDGRTVLAFLILIFMLLLAVPVIVYILIRKFCWIKVHPDGRTQWQTKQIPTEEDRNKKIQTEVSGLEMEEFYRRRLPVDMSKYEGKKLNEVDEYPRWYKLNPKQINDPWSGKYAGKETNFIQKVW